MLRKVLSHSSKAISKVHLPYTRKRVTWQRIKEANRILRPGDIVLTHIDGELTNIFLDYWSHGAIYGSDLLLHESVTKGKTETNLIYFLTQKDDFIILRPKFKVDMAVMLPWLYSKSGKEYDYEFETNDEQWYCFELIALALMMSSDQVINPVKILGREQYLAKSFLTDLFEVAPC